MPLGAKAIANYFLKLAGEEGKALSPMKVQKLVYYAHGWTLAVTGGALVNEQVEAWKFGPVIPTLYHATKEYGNGTIKERLRSHRVTEDGEVCEFIPTIGDKSDPDGKYRALVARVWKTYKKYSAIQLSNLTHVDGSPWDQIYKKYSGNIPKHTDIPAEMIRTYFVSLAKK